MSLVIFVKFFQSYDTKVAVHAFVDFQKRLQVHLFIEVSRIMRNQTFYQ